MMNLSRRIALMAMMLTLAIGGAMAQPPGGGRGDNGGGGGFERNPPPPPAAKFDHCLGTLDLTREQMAAIQQIKERLANAMEGFRATMNEKKQALMAAREAGDRELAASIMEEIKALEAQIAHANEAAHEAILGVLTDAQKAALHDCMESGKPGRGDRGRSGDHRMDCFSTIGLSETQLADIRALREAFHTSNQDLTQEIRELHRQLRAARRDGDRELYATLRAAIAEKMEALKAAQQALHESIMGVLTEEQRAALRDCMEDRKEPNGRGGIVMPDRNAPELK